MFQWGELMPQLVPTRRAAPEWQKPTPVTPVKRESPHAAEDSARSSKQSLADAIGNLFSVAEEVSVCFFCGSAQHDTHDCRDASKPAILKMLKDMKERLTVEDEPGIRPPNTGENETGATVEDVNMDDEPRIFNTSNEYQVV